MLRPAPPDATRFCSGRLRRVAGLPRVRCGRERPLWRPTAAGVLLLVARAGAAPRVFSGAMVNNLNAGRPLIDGADSLGVLTSDMLLSPANALPDDGFASCSVDDACYGAAGTTAYEMSAGGTAFRSMQSLRMLSRFCTVLPRRNNHVHLFADNVMRVLYVLDPQGARQAVAVDTSHWQLLALADAPFGEYSLFGTGPTRSLASRRLVLHYWSTAARKLWWLDASASFACCMEAVTATAVTCLDRAAAADVLRCSFASDLELLGPTATTLASRAAWVACAD